VKLSGLTAAGIVSADSRLSPQEIKIEIDKRLMNV